MDSYEIVVAHHNEDLSWLLSFPSESVHVYSKGEDATIPCVQYRLPNVGREAHTYFTYIIERYETLPSIVFFTQGCPHDHTSHIDSSSQGIYNSFINLGTYNYSQTYRFRPFLKGLNSDCHIRWWDGFELLQSDKNGYDWVHEYVDPTIDFSDCIFIFWGAIISVRKEAILSRQPIYYHRLLETVSTHKDHEVTHFLERTWFYVFQLGKFS